MNMEIPLFSDSEPECIRANSESIKSILMSEELDIQQLFETVEQREKIILEFLDRDPNADKGLLQDLLKTNQELTELVNTLRTDQQKVLVNFLRNRKAIKKYQ